MISFNFLGSESGKDELYKEVGQALIELASKYPHFSISMDGHGGTVTLSDGAKMDYASPAMLAYVLLALEEQSAAIKAAKGD
mgnify:CR=1 FL=1